MMHTESLKLSEKIRVSERGQFCFECDEHNKQFCRQALKVAFVSIYLV